MVTNPRWRWKEAQTGAGLGMKEPPPDNQTIRVATVKMMETLYYTGYASAAGHRSWGHNLAKNNEKEGVQGQRLIHLLDPFWACWLRIKHHEGTWEQGIPAWAHGFERGRRREDAILVA